MAVSRSASDKTRQRGRGPVLNRLGLPKTDYRGRPSTLCKGCGHDSISQRIVNVVWALGLEQHNVVKLSGIGCSSKTPAYFLQGSHGFNGLHGRMAALSTGVVIANRDLKVIGISGDGDTASIGIGHFKHAARRNIPMTYIVENNGVYGLTKGQFSATADADQALKHQGVNKLPPLDICMEALTANATFVARSFAGDPKQVEALLEAALRHRGIAVLDIISPCVTFNNDPQSTKSYAWGRANEVVINSIDFIPEYEAIEIEDYTDEIEVEMHDGSWIVLKKIGADHDPTSKFAAAKLLEDAHTDGTFITGLIYIDQARENLIELLDLTDESLARLPTSKLRPPPEVLDEINQTYMFGA